MRESSITPPRLDSLTFLVDRLKKTEESLDQGYFTLQDLVEKEGKKVDIAAFNSLIKACVERNDSSRAISTYRDANKLKVQPNVETFNLLLDGARKAGGHVDLAMYVLSELKNSGISPNEGIYTSIIMTYLQQQGEGYDSAFMYLEEMKAAGYIPKKHIYAMFVRKCVYHNDDRALMVLEEMEKVGYNITGLSNYVKNAARMGSRSSLMDVKIARMGNARREEREESRELLRMFSEHRLREEKREHEKIEEYDDDNEIEGLLRKEEII